MCELCRAQGGKCVECMLREQQALPDGSGRAQAATIGLVLGACVDAAGSLVSIGKLAMGGATSATTDAGTASVALMDVLDGLVGIAQSLIFLTTAILFLRWWHLMARHALMRGVTLGATPGWAVGYWFIPFVNLVRPAQIARTAAAGFGVTAPINGWWAFWVISNIASQVSARMNMSELQHGGADISAGADLAAQVLSIPAALLCIAVVRAIQKGIVNSAVSASANTGLQVPAAA